ncbi:orotate phosphoribosyltransferase [Candidatus Curtissbacteria bacterium RIFCSPLOWO2_01_FULL_37_9]|uniref:Orotate phosphoribosyltransferase n=1 Tax=Candidatus Curtissbacteria bacterium RIFCSPLOWO2_01_FULL_37_9 TaxID=1797724 RepID=A0A1F5GTV5_9BACT|nr:MAG: orotate phosphoribosyltransferase [Candidatus Curtissbacteria bacterium RIFCSPLOWO2_01_FULL_37_9]
MKSTNTDKVAFDVASLLFEIGAILIRPDKPFKYTSGILSPIYTDNRLILSFPKVRNKIIKYMIEKVRQISMPDLIAGTATAGIPYAAIIAHQLNLPMVYVRPNPKNYGKKNQIEGKVKRGNSALVIEDLVTTAKSSFSVITALRKSGAVVKNELVIFTYGLKSAENRFKLSQVNCYALSNLKTVTDFAIQKGILEQDQSNRIFEWAKNPQKWSQEHKG